MDPERIAELLQLQDEALDGMEARPAETLNMMAAYARRGAEDSEAAASALLRAAAILLELAAVHVADGED